jgi:hypothetical protein
MIAAMGGVVTNESSTPITILDIPTVLVSDEIRQTLPGFTMIKIN